MNAPKRVADDVLIDAYRRLGNVHKVGAEVGIRGGSVHERLVKLGVQKPMNVFTEEERSRVEAEYVIYRAAGKVGDLAAEMGRTVPFLSRQARALGITNARFEKHYAGKWKYMSESAARILMDDFKSSRFTLTDFCERRGIDDDGIRKVMAKFFPDEWEHVIESKAPKQSMYRRGREFEYRVRDLLRKQGFFVLRSPASKSPTDLVAIRPGLVLFVQAKRGGSLPPGEWNEIYELARSCGAVPILADGTGATTRLFEMTDRKDGSKRRQPMVPYEVPAFETVTS